MLNRVTPHASASLVFTATERDLLNHLVPPSAAVPPPSSVADYLIAVARLGGYLARQRDPPPGNMVLWRGFSRLADIHLGFSLAQNCG